MTRLPLTLLLALGLASTTPAQDLRLVLPIGHTDIIWSAQFSPDGKTIVTASGDNTAKVWDATTGKELHALKRHYESVRSAQFSPDGTTIVTASLDKTAKVWNVDTGKELQALEGHSKGVNDAQFSPDGKTIVTASSDNIAKVWDATTGKELHPLEGHSDGVRTAQFSPDGKTIVTASDDNTAIVWDAATGNRLHTLNGHRGWVVSAQFSPDGKNIVTASFDNTAIVWDAAKGKKLYGSLRHTDDVRSAQFSPDGKTIVTASGDNTAKVWDVSTGKELHALTGHGKDVKSAQFSPDGKTIVTASGDNTAKLWNAKTGKEMHPLEGHSEWLNSARFSPDGKTIVTASWDETVIVWDAITGKEMHPLQGFASEVYSAKFSSDGETIVTTSGNRFSETILGTARAWDAATGKELQSIQGYSFEDNSAQFSPDGKTIVTPSDDHTVNVWDVATGEILYTHLFLEGGGWLAWDPEYRYDGSPEAIEQLHFACGLEVIELSQAKGALYVPNLVSRIISGEDLIGLPGLDDLDLCGRTPIVTPLPGDGRGYRFDIEPRKGGVSTCEVYIDGVRRFNIPASDLQPQNDGHLLLTVSADQVAEYATASEAEVTVIARTSGNLISRGLKTWAAVANPRGNSQDSKPSFHGLFVGINDYKGDGLKLNYAAADARELGQVVEAAAAKMFGADEVHITTLLSDAAKGAVTNPPEKHRILAELEDIAGRSNARDILFIHLAGHGNVNADGEFVFLTSEASSLQDGDYTGVTMSEINDALMGVKASQRILILDACHSGEAVQDLMGDGNMDMAYTARNSVSLEEDVARGRQLERLGDNANMTMLTASASDQAAFELPEIGHGLLTFALLDAIQGHTDILAEGRFLEVKPWIYQAEKTVNDRSKGPNRQQAQALTPANYPIGEITADVRDLIQIEEKPVIKRIVFEDENEEFAVEFEEALKLAWDGAGGARGTGAVLINEQHPNGFTLRGTAFDNGDGTYDVTFRIKRGRETLAQDEARAVTATEVVQRVEAALDGQ